MALVHEGHGLQPVHISGAHLVDAKAVPDQDIRNIPIEVTTGRDAPPGGRQAILPPAHVRFGRATMLDEDQLSSRLQHTPRFRHRAIHVRNAAHGPGRQDGVDAAVLDRNRLG